MIFSLVDFDRNADDALYNIGKMTECLSEYFSCCGNDISPEQQNQLATLHQSAKNIKGIVEALQTEIDAEFKLYRSEPDEDPAMY